MADLLALLELARAEALRSQGPGVAKARAEDEEVLRWRSESHAKQLHKISQLLSMGLTQAEIARRMHISDTHLCKLIRDGHSRGNRFQTEHAEALDEILLRAKIEAVRCG